MYKYKDEINKSINRPTWINKNSQSFKKKLNKQTNK